MVSKRTILVMTALMFAGASCSSDGTATTSPSESTATSTSPTTVGVTNSAVEAVCDIKVVLDDVAKQPMWAAIATDENVPTNLECIDGWAAWSGSNEIDGYVAAAKWENGTWVLQDVGTSICPDGIPSGFKVVGIEC
jgi:hypothetical protein